MSLALRGTLVTSNNNKKDDKKVFWLEYETKDKKTSFVYDETIINGPSSLLLSSSDDTFQIVLEKPCQLLIDCCSSSIPNNNVVPLSTTSFLFGGLEIHSNARIIEAYVLYEDNNNDDNNQNNKSSSSSSSSSSSFEYWDTYRGTTTVTEMNNGKQNHIQLQRENQHQHQPHEQELYKTIILPPNSKPTPILKLQLKLLSLRPAKCNMGYIRLVKVKGKLPDVNVIDDNKDTSNVQSSLPLPLLEQSKRPSHPNVNATSKLIQESTIRNNNNNNNNSISNNTSQITNAISAITILIQNAQEKMERSISNKYGELQTISFQHNAQVQSTLVSLQRSISDINDNIKSLRVDLDTLIDLQQQQNSLQQTEDTIDNDDKEYQHEYEHERDNDEINNDNDNRVEDIVVTRQGISNNFDLSSSLESHKAAIRGMLIEERKQIIEEMDLRRDDIVKQVVEAMSKEKTMVIMDRDE